MTEAEFIQKFQEELRHIKADYSLASSAAQFAVWTGWKLYGMAPEQVVDNLLANQDASNPIVAYLDESSDNLHITICYYAADADIPLTAAHFQQCMRLWDDLREGRLERTPVGDQLSMFMADYSQASIAVATNTFFEQEAQIEADKQDVQWIDFARLRAQYLRRQHPLSIQEPEMLEVPIVNGMAFPGPPMETGQNTVPSYICVLPLTLIHQWVDRYHNGLFAENLRLHLSRYDKEAAKLEQEIEQTVRDSPERMFTQNNGLTITCANLKPEGEPFSATRLLLSSPQIVNGCQTSWAIHNAIETLAREGKTAPNGFIIAKIVQTQDGKVQEQIATSSNRQNAIQPRDRRAKDPYQIEISRALSQLTGNMGIYWDYERGGWDNIVDNNEEANYQLKNEPKKHRMLMNTLGGQIMLSLAGQVAVAKNSRSSIYDIDRFYNMAFGYDRNMTQRFEGLTEPLPTSGGGGAINNYVRDLLFGYAIYQHAEAAFKDLHAERITSLRRQADNTIPAELDTLTRMRQNVASRDFVTYWTYDIVRLVYIAVVTRAEQESREIADVQKMLVGDLKTRKFLDPLFMLKSKRPRWFCAEEDNNKANTLSTLKPSEELPILGQWFKSLEEIGAEVIAEAQSQEPGISARTLILSRSATHGEIVRKLQSKLNSSLAPQLFPLS